MVVAVADERHGGDVDLGESIEGRWVRSLQVALREHRLGSIAEQRLGVGGQTGRGPRLKAEPLKTVAVVGGTETSTAAGYGPTDRTATRRR
ncbi:hypothetical protein GCM10009682_23010 [Luedemannella flava]|uniref:Uncharacterized protein n=1 Tax=Luedemannella flava TaxID=349316 RepID=A0ABP4Y6F3_9ACTN